MDEEDPGIEDIPPMEEPPEDPLVKALQSMTFNQAVDSLGVEALKQALLAKFSVYDKGRINIERQLDAIKTKITKDKADTTHRVDRLINLMTSNAAFIRQMIDLLDDYGNKLSTHEKNSIRHQMEYAAVVERMNRMAKNFVQLENNQREIVDAIESLRQKQEEDDRFRWKLVWFMGIVGSLVGWLCFGEHLKTLIVVLQKSLFGD